MRPRRCRAREWKGVDDRELHTIKRRSDEPKVEIGDTILMRDGVNGTVLARYTPTAHKDEIRYIVQAHARKHAKRSH